MKQKPHPLIHLRKKLDVVDKKIIKLLGERMRIVRKVGKLKAKTSLPALDENRWKEIEEKNARLSEKYNVPI